MNFISVNKATELLKATRITGRLFGVWWTKDNGDDRHAVGKIFVKKAINGNGLAYDPLAQGLLPIYDTKKEQYRQVRLANVKAIQVDGVTYQVKK